MELRVGLLTIDVQTFQIASTIAIHLYPPSTFGIRTIVVHIIASGMNPSPNTTYVKLTTLSQASVSVYFSLVASRSHDLRCSAIISNGPPVRHEWILCTAAVIYYPSEGPSVILAGYNRIGSDSTPSDTFV